MSDPRTPPPPPNTSPDRLLIGFERLLNACNNRLVATLPSPVPPEQDPRFLLNYSLGYLATGLSACRLVLASEWPAHAVPIARPLFEHAARVLWAVRGRWDRYWAWSAHTYVTRMTKAAPFVRPAQAMVSGSSFSDAELRAAGQKMPGLPEILEDLAQDDINDPETPESRLGIKVSARNAREQFHLVFTLDMHLAAHGNPDMFLRSQGSEARRLSWALSYVALMAGRACHILCRWRQDPLYWAYGWISRGRKEPTEPEPSPSDSYGMLGLPPLSTVVS